jgi:hypothetical protein
MSARRVSQILVADSAFGDLVAATRRMEQLQRIYLEAVPATLGAASRVGWARAGVLLVLASNSAVAAKLRHTAPRILASFERHGLQFNSMRIRVQVGAASEIGRRARAATLSPHALRALESAARELPPSPLKAAMHKLARRASKQALEHVEQRQHGRDDER